MKVLILGATGLVGRFALAQALAHAAISSVIAPSRTPLQNDAKLTNPVAARIESLVPQVPDWKPDALICCLGTTIGKAGSQHAFRDVDYVLPLTFAQAAHSCGASAMALVTAMGASTQSRFFYARTKGELEREVQLIGFRSLTIVRPSIIGGERQEFRFAESVALRAAQLLGPILPKNFRLSPAPAIAAALIEAIVEHPTGCHFRNAGSLT